MIVSLVRPSKHIVRPALILVLLTSILTLMAETTFGHSTDQESPGGSVYPQAVDGNPVDLATGLYMLEEQDFVFPDWIPILLTRVYRSRDSGMRAFGLGASHSFEIYLLRNDLCSEIRLILPDGAYIQYKRQAGTNCLDSVLTHKGTPTVFYNSSLSWKPDEFRWILQREDGVSFRFNDFLVLTEVQNAQGHRLTVGRDPSQRVVSITSPCGCWLKFVRDNQGKIVRIEDFLGRRANYEYDARGRLSRVEYPGQKRVSLYTYDSEDRMISIGDENGPYFWNDYDEHGKVVTQRHPDGTKYQFRYVVTDTGETRQTIVKTRTGEVRIATFNDAGRIVSDTWDAEGARSRTSQYKWDTESNQLQGVMIQDALESKREGSARTVRMSPVNTMNALKK